jgi:exopolysaccharide biosynthesis polyprenyl glycosylphosphotransferase
LYIAMRNNSAIIYRLTLVLGDFLALAAAFTAAYILRVKLDDRSLIEQIPAETYIYGILVVLPLWIVVHGSIGLYSRNIQENRFGEFGRLILGSFLGILVVIGYDFVTASNVFPARLVPVYGVVLSFGFLVLFRSLVRLFRRALFSYGVGIANLLIVGDAPSARSVVAQFADTKHSGYRIIGVVGTDKQLFGRIPVYESLELAHKAFTRSKKPIHSIIQTKIYKDDEKNSSVLSYAQIRHIEYRFIPGNSELYTGNIEVELFREIPMVTVHQTALVGWGRVVKRLFDITVGGLLFIIFSPLMLVSAFFIKLFNPRESLIFTQTRLTQFDRPFVVYKFRSQKSRFDGTTPEEAFRMIGEPRLAKAYREGGDHVPKDPRLLRLGRLIRAMSIDELPQLINVIRGDISLVGPRALIPEELEAYQQKHHILSVKSGLTGLAQVSGRREISFEERRKLDVYYVQNWSFWLDIVILIKTLRAVIGGVGAK